MSKIHYLQIETARPCAEYPQGKVLEAYYRIDGGELVMTDEHGAPVHLTNGKTFTAKLGPDDNPTFIASRLARQVRNELHPLNDFNRPLGVAPRTGW
jgi:hypothetical protein